MRFVRRLFRRWRSRPGFASESDLRTIAALITAIEARHRETARHSNRVQTLAMLMGRMLGWQNAELRNLSTAALLHDIGKLAIPDNILTKPGKLTAAELQVVRTHSAEGASMLERIGFSCEVASIVRAHHERVDGAGYPDGLRGDQIPTASQLIAVADCFDALCSQRQYRNALSPGNALELIRRDSGLAFSPEAVDLLTRAIPHLYDLPATSSDVSLTECGNPTRGGWGEYGQRLISVITAALPHDAVVLWREQGGSMQCALAIGRQAEDLLNLSIRVGDGISGWVASSGQDLISSNPHLEGSAEIFSQFRSVLAIPLEQGSVISVYSSETNAYRPEHATALRAACSRTSA